MSKSAENGFGAASRYVSVDGRASKLPQSELYCCARGVVSQSISDRRFTDVAISLGDEQSVGIYYGQSDGTFYLATELNTGENVGGLAVGDFNNDGHIDVAAGLMLAQQGVIFFNSGSGQFSRSFFASGADTVSMTAADLNHSGKTDLIITNFGVDFRPPNVDVVFHK